MNNQTIRRLKIYLPRLRRMITGSNLKANCCFIHIPKSGGSSIHEALKSLVPFNKYIGAIDAIHTRIAAGIVLDDTDDSNVIHEDGPRCTELFKFRENQLITYMSQSMPLVYGHVLFSSNADKYFSDTYKYVTVLRDPIKRVISNYRSAYREGFYTKDFDSYLTSDVAWRHATLNLRYFSGIAEIPRNDVESALVSAKENMRKFSVIGTLDNLDRFCEDFHNVFGMRPQIPHYNIGEGSTIELSDQQLDTLTSLCMADIKLHELASSTPFKHQMSDGITTYNP